MESEEGNITVQLDDDFTFSINDITVPDYTWTTVSASCAPSGTISLDGDDADILIDGISLRKTLQGLNDRLAILQVNPELEAEFDELHSLAEQYRALERKLLEKKKIWNVLTSSG